MANRIALVPWDAQPFEAGVIADEFFDGIATVIDGGQVVYSRYASGLNTAYNVKGTRSSSARGRGFLGSASSVITAETGSPTPAAAPIFDIAGGDWTFQIVIDGIDGAGANPGFWRSGTGYADAYFFIQNAATRRPWVRIFGVDVLKPASGAQWTTGQRINLVVRLKSASSVDVWWDGRKQHSATHTTSQSSLTGAQAIHGLMFQSDVTQYTAGNAVAIRFWNRYLSDGQVMRIAEDEFAIYQPRVRVFPTSVGGPPSWSAAIAESATAADNVLAVLTSAASLSESASATDALTAAAVVAKALTEAASAADSAAATGALVAALQEAASSGDAQAATLIAVAALAAAVTASESLSTGDQYAAALIEAAAASDAAASVATWVRALTEAAAAGHAQAAAALLVAALTDAASAADAVASLTPATYSASASELAAALDALAGLFSSGAPIDFDSIRRVVRGGLITRLVQEAIARSTKGQ